MMIAAASMHSAITFLKNFFPDWGSLDSVRFAHSRMELDSIIFFGLLALAEAIAHRCKDEVRKNILGVVGIVFFVIAVACEGIAYPYGQRSDELSERVIISLSDIAGKAVKDSQSARENAGIAKTLSAGAVAVAGTAKDKADAVRKEADEAEVSAAHALRLATDANTEVAKTNERFAPRELSRIKRELLIKFLKDSRIKPREAVRVESFGGAEDGVSYAVQIVDAINDPSTGWKAVFAAQNAFGGTIKGVVIVLHDPQSAPPWAKALQDALKMSGIGGEGTISAEQVKRGRYHDIRRT